MDRTTPPHILTLVAATAVGALATNVFLPSLPGMARDFGVDYAAAQLTVPVFLVANAVMQIVIGPLSDRFGRRPVMLGAFAVFNLATFVSLFATSFPVLLALRVLQASSAAGMALSRAIVRDTVSANEAASRIGYITMGMTVMPMIGPVLGGLLDAPFGWRGSWGVMLVAGLIALAAVALDLGETNHARTASFAAQFRVWPLLLRSRRFWGYALAGGFTGGCYFALLGGGPLVATETLRVSPAAFGANLVIIGVGYMSGNFLSGRYARHAGIDAMMLTGNVVASIGLLAAIVLFWSGVVHPLSLFGPMALLGVGNGLTLPSTAAGIVSVRPDLAGSASGLGGALQIGISAVMSVFAGLAVAPHGAPLPLLGLMFGSALAAILFTLLARSDRAVS